MNVWVINDDWKLVKNIYKCLSNLFKRQIRSENKGKKMRNSEMKWLCVLFVMVVISVVSAEECEVEIRGMTIECTYYMNKSDQRLLTPNDRCKKAIRDVFPKLQCWCNSLSRKVGMFFLFLFFYNFFTISLFNVINSIQIYESIK